MTRTLERTAVTPTVRNVRVIDSPLGPIAMVGWGGFLRQLHFDVDAFREGQVRLPSICSSGSRLAGRQVLDLQGTPKDFAVLDREHPVASQDVDAMDVDAMEWDSRDPVLLQAEGELAEYFAGERLKFGVPVRLAGTTFQQRVWDHLRSIPYGETCTYGALAAKIGSPLASRAVGAALGKNPVGIIVPCHRVIGSTGKLVGFAGGIDVKRRLLELEQRMIPE